MLSNLIYTSKRSSFCTDKEIDSILEACERNNSHKSITGVLLYSENLFIQYLEGGKEELMQLYDKIKTDDRHNDVVIISSRQINKRIFPGWSMGRKNLDKNSLNSIGKNCSFENKEELDETLRVQNNEELISTMHKLFVSAL